MNNNTLFFIKNLKHIVNINNKYELLYAYRLDDNNEVVKLDIINNNCDTHECERCIHCLNNCCLIRTNLENCDKNTFIPCKYVEHCDAYSPIFPLTKINSKYEMIEFINKVHNLFDSPESYEEYFGFIDRKYDNETGKILESALDYYNRGGEFTKIPTQFPCVIYFGLVDFAGGREYNEKLEWILI